MTQEARLLRLIGETDDQYRRFAEGACPSATHARPAWLKWVAIAACLAVLLASVTYRKNHSGTIVFPGENRAYSYPTVATQQAGNQQAAASYIDYAELADKAQVIVCADVIQAFHEKTDMGYLVYAEIEVLETLKGDIPTHDTLYVEDTAGGFVDTDGQYQVMTLYGDPLLEKGNRVLLFLYKPPEPIVTKDGKELYSLYGSVGKFFYDTDGKYHWSVLYNEEYPEDYKSTAVLRDSEPKTLEEIKELIMGRSTTAFVAVCEIVLKCGNGFATM